jgi:F0F1-type ATP synthase assembly protein I
VIELFRLREAFHKVGYTGLIVRVCADAQGGVHSRSMAKKNRSFSYSRSAKSLQENAERAGSAAGASYTLVGAIMVLGGIGYGIDKWRDTGPWGLIIGLTLGVVVGFYDLVKTTWR